MNAPAPSPSIMPRPDSESALVAEKNPPMLQPKASTAPTPIRSPPALPLASSARAGTRIANSRERSAAIVPPMMTPMFSREPE